MTIYIYIFLYFIKNMNNSYWSNVGWAERYAYKILKLFQSDTDNCHL